MTSDALFNIANKTVKLFQAIYPDKGLKGSLLDQCKEASQYLQNCPTLMYLNQLFPFQFPTAEIPGEAQLEKYAERIGQSENDQLFKNIWIPLPIDVKEIWSEDRIKNHLRAGFPIYIKNCDSLLQVPNSGVYHPKLNSIQSSL